MASPSNRSLTIGDLAERTGVPPATLRSWEARYGFPRPTRLDGGHRRYAEADVAVVLEVLRQRATGLALATAVGRATRDAPRPRSVYAELRRRHHELRPQVLSKASLVALSHTIEDECCARAERPVLFGGFQRDAFLEAARGRWAELARTARSTAVFAAGAGAGATGVALGPGVPAEIPIPPDAPLNREWIVICDAPDMSSCLVAVERPGQDPRPDAGRRFEAVWTVDPQVVRDASRAAASLADEFRPGWRTQELDVLESRPPVASDDLRRASDLLQRTVGYLDARRS